MKLISALFARIARPALLALAALMAVPSAVAAHGGGLDGQGCHHNRKAGGYHCHRGPLAGKSFLSKPDAGRALAPPDKPAIPRTLVGKAHIVDGNTIEISGRRIGLFGIIAPKPGQLCDAAGRKWACGQNATFGLSAIVERQWVHCRLSTPEKNGRITAICRLAGANGPDINAAMVRQGWAMADTSPPAPYVAEEATARAAKAGIWVGSGFAR